MLKKKKKLKTTTTTTTTTTNILNIHVEKNAIKDIGEGVVAFPQGLTITDNTEQRNGTKYDIKSMDMSEYKGNLTADHGFSIRSIIGKTTGLRKIANKRVTIDGIKFAVKESSLAQFAYNMLKAGFATDFSIETTGPYPDDEGIYNNSKLLGLSLVVIGNNKSATVNTILRNSIKQSQDVNVDVTDLNSLLLKNSINSSKQMLKKKKKLAKRENSIENITAAINAAIAPVAEKLEKVEKAVFNSSVKEPKFKKSKESGISIISEFSQMDYTERHKLQLNNAWDALRTGNVSAMRKLREINKFHVEKLQEAKIVSNSMDVADFGNFVISPELLTDIEGVRSNFQALLGKVKFKETLSLQMSYLKRDGDIDMTSVDKDASASVNANLKPVKEYDATIATKDLEELAAVTPIATSATRFLAVDMLDDIAQGYRTDYDRKKAQLVIARLQQAVDVTNYKSSFATDTDVNTAKSLIDVIVNIAGTVENGTFILNHSSYWRLVKAAMGAGISGPLASLFTTGDIPLMLGRPYIVVPNELLPNLDTATTKTFVIDGGNVTIDQGLFYADLSTFSGRTSGGLKYDLSTEAAYEESGVVKSAFQRNELVLRGAFFRGGAVRDDEKVAGLSAPGVS